MKRILYVTTVSLTLNTFLIPHIRHLINHGFQVDIASNIDVPLDKTFEKMEIIHYKINFSRNPLHPKNIEAYREIKRLQEENNYDIVHVHTPVASFVTRMALRSKSVKMIYTAHGFHFYDGAPLINWALYYPLEKLAARWTDTLVTINDEDMMRGKKFNLRNNGQVYKMPGVGIKEESYEIENFNRNRYRKSLGLKKDDFAILVLAELNKNKNHMQIIKAIDELKEKCPRIKLICAGKGPKEKELKRVVKYMKLEENVKFIGFRRDITQLLYCSDCVGLFSHREGLGKCLLEGMIAGKPIIATNTRGPKELIEDGANGFLVEVDDYKHLAEYLEKIYGDQEMQNRFGEKSKEKVKEFYLDKVLQEVINFY
ncbi:glycosyltransferase family 4 protein [Clostridium culturomicium]|uniref:glycosyltransferase family 4 protein n=1 Tax=Clostridium culturomicium TaxID=1499683 RepID=UPI00058DE432|nr:glycosyltransferase family 4 protein [Clostridium culturomicium]